MKTSLENLYVDIGTKRVNMETEGGHRKCAEVITLYPYQCTKFSCKVMKKISGRTDHNTIIFW